MKSAPPGLAVVEPPPVSDLQLDHVEFYVGDLEQQLAFWTDSYGFRIAGRGGSPEEGFRSVLVRQGAISLVLTEGLDPAHPACAYVRAHGDGVANIGLRTRDAHAVFESAVRVGACPLTPPDRHDRDKDVIHATLASGLDDVTLTLLEREQPAGEQQVEALPPGFELAAEPVRTAASNTSLEAEGEVGADIGTGLLEVDHFAVCVRPGQMAALTDLYVRAFGFREIYEERIVVGGQAMLSKVVQSATKSLTFTVIEPDPTADPGQIDTFLAEHGGSGVQHIAFSTVNVVASVPALAERGVAFLTTPGLYYEVLSQRVAVTRHPLAELRRLSVLVDEDHDGQLFQIFTRSVHPRNTLFFEVIERFGGTTFGSANIKALYEVVELERQRHQALGAQRTEGEGWEQGHGPAGRQERSK
ncbi:4-hydroxyphenylpyruvate dioxygenase [Streptomyces sp. NPDC060048]|uniref:4-hydroxyphenylpyruvate dioxygenase n=1 Tax=unclassified Streptomyces TaxID=2593676 RepID=UPI0036B2F1D3